MRRRVWLQVYEELDSTHRLLLSVTVCYCLLQVYEELDEANEFFYDASSRELHLIYNGSDGRSGAGSTPPSTLDVPVLHTLVRVYGGQENPVRRSATRCALPTPCTSPR